MGSGPVLPKLSRNDPWSGICIESKRSRQGFAPEEQLSPRPDPRAAPPAPAEPRGPPSRSRGLLRPRSRGLTGFFSRLVDPRGRQGGREGGSVPLVPPILGWWVLIGPSPCLKNEARCPNTCPPLGHRHSLRRCHAPQFCWTRFDNLTRCLVLSPQRKKGSPRRGRDGEGKGKGKGTSGEARRNGVQGHGRIHRDGNRCPEKNQERNPALSWRVGSRGASERRCVCVIDFLRLFADAGREHQVGGLRHGARPPPQLHDTYPGLLLLLL